jgi:hypothetical protein
MKFKALALALVVGLTGCVTQVSQERLDAALADSHSRMKALPDKFTGRTFYQHRAADAAFPDTMKIYYSVDGQGTVSDLRMKFTYLGKEWIFAKQVIVLIDNDRFVFTPPEWKREIGGLKGVVESADFSLTGAAFDAVRKMTRAEKVELQFRGDQNTWEQEVKKIDCQIMQIVVASWEKRKIEAKRSHPG